MFDLSDNLSELLMVIITNSGRYFHTFLVETVSRYAFLSNYDRAVTDLPQSDHGVLLYNQAWLYYQSVRPPSIFIRPFLMSCRFSQDLQLVDMELPLNATNASGCKSSSHSTTHHAL
jgi:hypothetical protein